MRIKYSLICLVLTAVFTAASQAAYFSFTDNFNYNGSNASLYASYANISTTFIIISGLVRNLTISNGNSGDPALIYLSLNTSKVTNLFSDQNATFTLESSYNIGFSSSPAMDFPHWGYFFKAASPPFVVTTPNLLHNGLPTNGYFIGFRKGASVAFDANFSIIRTANGVSTVLNHTPPFPHANQLNITLNVSEGMIYVFNSTLANGKGTVYLMLSYNDSSTNATHFGYSGFSYGYGLLSFATFSNFTISALEYENPAYITGINQSEKMGDTGVHIIKGTVQNAGGLVDALLKPEYLFASAVLLALSGLAYAMKKV